MVQSVSSLLEKLPGKTRPYLMAHRGNHVKFPENTLAAFRQAIKDGTDIIETDLHLSRDNDFICIHDDTVDRTTNGTGMVSGLSTEEIKSLKALDKFGDETDQRVPLLSELAEMLPADVALALELKSDRFLEADVCRELGYLLEEKKVQSRTIAISFSMERLQVIRESVPKIPVGWITLKRIIPDKNVDLIGPLWPILCLNPFYVRSAHKRNMLICPLDPNPAPRLKAYIRKGCDAVLADNPGEVRILINQILDSRQEH